MLFFKHGIALPLLFVSCCSLAQGSPDKNILDSQKVSGLSPAFFSHVQHSNEQLDKRLSKQTRRYLARMLAIERTVNRDIFKTDTAAAQSLLSPDVVHRYGALANNLSGDTAGVVRSMGPEYLPFADTLQTALAYISKHPENLLERNVKLSEAQAALQSMTQIQLKLQSADEVKRFVQERVTLIKDAVAKLAEKPTGISSALQAYNKQAYYYADQVREYRRLLNDPDRLVRTALGKMNQIPAFSAYMHKYSFLSSLFSVPADYAASSALEGLQTRDQVLALIQSQVGPSGGSGMSAIQQSLTAAQQDVNKIRDKLNSLGSGSGDMTMPKFNPNNQKKKTFFGRLEYGVNLQTVNASRYFPTYSDLAVSVGYKINNSSVAGIGASYKLGWGNGINHIAFSSEGLGIRSFMDIKIKNSFFASGGFEYNYMNPFRSLQQLKQTDRWTKSGLVGVTKIVSMRNRVFKKTKVQLLWDFLSYQQIPKTQPILFRIGYTF